MEKKYCEFLRMDLPPGYKLTKIGSSNSGILVRMIGSVIFLIVLLVVFMISKVNSEMQLKLRQMELQNERLASKGQVIMDTISIEPVSMSVLTTSPEPESVPMSVGNDVVSPTKWKQFVGKDVRYRDTFHLHTNTTPKANLENCLKRCDQQDDCKGVATDNSHSLCWGKTGVTGKTNNNTRRIYEKSEDGVLPPWDGGTQWADHPWNTTPAPAPAPAPAPTPAPASASNVSTNGRCGPSFNDTICPGKQCCSGSNWCAGTQGTYSAWCYSNKKGRDNGKYDGKSN